MSMDTNMSEVNSRWIFVTHSDLETCARDFRHVGPNRVPWSERVSKRERVSRRVVKGEVTRLTTEMLSLFPDGDLERVKGSRAYVELNALTCDILRMLVPSDYSPPTPQPRVGVGPRYVCVDCSENGIPAEDQKEFCHHRMRRRGQMAQYKKGFSFNLES